MISAQRMADRFPPAVLKALSTMAGEIRSVPLPDCDGRQRSPDIVANAWLRGAGSKLEKAQLQWAFDEEAIRAFADNYSRLCSRMASLEARASFAAFQRVAVPSGRKVTREGVCRRMDDPLWWRRQLRKVWTRSSEDTLRDIGLVRAGRAPYASDAAVRYILRRQARHREWMGHLSLVSEDGEILNMLDVHDHSLANPAMRRGEFMCRLRGFEEFARERGDDSLFITLTAPSAFHAQRKAGGRNPAFQRESVRAAQKWLCKMWARFRSRMKRKGIEIYGFRIAEPHHDGTPHWHGILFFQPDHAETINASLRELWLSEYSDELGAEQFRFKGLRPDTSKGTATGYIAKYVAKNIDGAGVIGDQISDETGRPVLEDVSRVVAWANIHGIRQFQQIGGPPVGLWREFRRLHTESKDTPMETARLAAHAGEWSTFTSTVLPPGASSGRYTTVRLKLQQTMERNRYGEECRPRILGLCLGDNLEVTRPTRWRLEKAIITAPSPTLDPYQ